MIRDLKKVLLHIHLDGSVRIETANELLNKDVTKEMTQKKYNDLNDYLTKFAVPISIMQTKENLERISEELAIDLKKDNIIYAEIRFAPIFHTQELTLSEVVDSVLNGLRKVDIKTNLILCMMRGLSFSENEKIVYLAKDYLNKGVVGIDLAGAEGIYKTKDYEDLFKLASKLDIPYTIHAGEADGIDSINSAIYFNAKRIGHGVRCIEDNKTTEEIINKKITLEICPKSNIDTQIYDEYKAHPIKKLYDKGVRVTINTDNNTVSNITLSDEYMNLVKTFDFTKEDFLKINIYAIEASFLHETEKEQMINYLINSYGKGTI